MRVYILNREYWHYVDGSWTTFIAVYAALQDAQDERDRLNETEGHHNDEDWGAYYEVVEEYVK